MRVHRYRSTAIGMVTSEAGWWVSYPDFKELQEQLDLQTEMANAAHRKVEELSKKLQSFEKEE